MGSITSTITLSVLGNFATDLIRWAAGGRVEPLDHAIQSTANSFPELEGLEETLRRWLRSPSVGEAIGEYVRGESAQNDLPIPTLVSDLVNKTGFYVAQHSAPVLKITMSVLTRYENSLLYLILQPLPGKCADAF